MLTRKKSIKSKSAKKLNIADSGNVLSKTLCEDEKYLEMIWKELGKCPPGKNSEKHSDLVHLMVYTQLETPVPKTPFRAIQAILCAGHAGLPMPPWAYKCFYETIYARLKNEIKSLDAAFGFSSTGKGKRTPSMLKKLISDRNDMLCKDVYGWRVLGESLHNACIRVVGRLKATPKWNHTAYNLDLVRAKSKKDNKDEMVESLMAIYSKWIRVQKNYENNPTLKGVRDRVLENPREFEKHFD